MAKNVFWNTMLIKLFPAYIKPGNISLAPVIFQATPCSTHIQMHTFTWAVAKYTTVLIGGWAVCLLSEQYW